MLNTEQAELRAFKRLQNPPLGGSVRRARLGVGLGAGVGHLVGEQRHYGGKVGLLEALGQGRVNLLLDGSVARREGPLAVYPSEFVPDLRVDEGETCFWRGTTSFSRMPSKARARLKRSVVVWRISSAICSPSQLHDHPMMVSMSGTLSLIWSTRVEASASLSRRPSWRSADRVLAERFVRFRASAGVESGTSAIGGSAAGLAAAFFAPKATFVLGRGAAAGAMNVRSGDIPAHVTAASSSSSAFTHSNRSSCDRGRGLDAKDKRERSRGRGGGSGKDKIDALGRLLTRILRHMAFELNLNMRSDGFVKVQDLLKLDLKTFANMPLRLHTVDDIKEAARKDNKQRFSLLEENGELWVRANQGHTVATVATENLLKPILSAEEVPVCVHGTYNKNLELILEQGLKRMKRLHVHFSCGLPTDGEVISGMRRDVNILIFLDVKKALQEGMKLYISDNKVILTEGFDGVVPVKYFKKIESWPDRKSISFLVD
nr:tRNA 2'-phosphotransferase 1 isoform X1 [Ipomoea batatas]